MQHLGPADPALPMERSHQVDVASQQTLQDARSCWAKAIDRTLDVLLAVALLVELTIVFCSIISRSVFSVPWHWTNEAAEMSLTTIAFLGGAYAYRRGEHAFIRTLVEALPLERNRPPGRERRPGGRRKGDHAHATLGASRPRLADGAVATG